MRLPSCEPPSAIPEASSALRRGAQFEQPRETRRIRPGGAGGGHHPIVAGEFPFAIDLAECERGDRMQCEHGAGDPCEQVGPVVAPCDVRQFVQQDVIQLHGSQVAEQRFGQDDGGMLEPDCDRHGHCA